MATGALLAQVVFVYWFTAAHKAGAEWWQEGSAVYYALSLDRLATPVGLLLLDLPALLPLLTYAVIWFEVLGPLLLFVPIFTEQFRTLGVGAFLLLQLGFGLCLALGLFPWISAVAMLPFVPPWFWDCCVPQFKTLLSGMARGSWTPLLPVLRELQERGKAAEHEGEDGPGGVSQLRPTSAPSVVGAASWVTSGGMALLLGYVVCFLLTTLKDTPVHMPQWGTWLGSTLQLHQRWAMFAPRPPQFSGWYVMSGRLADGTWLDLWHGGGAVRWEKPRLVSATYRNQRWRKYLRILAKEKYEGYRGYFAQYLCTQWNGRHQGEEHLEEVIIYFMREDTLPAYQATTPYPILLWQQRCTVSHTDGLG
jgi:hypothetical protein